MLKKIIIGFLLVFTVSTVNADMTTTLDGRPTSDWCLGSTASGGRNKGILWAREVETILEAWTIAAEGDGLLTFPSYSGTITNDANGFTIYEATEEESITLTFDANDIIVSSSTGCTYIDFDTMIVKADEFIFKPIADANTAEGTVFYDSDDDNLYVKTTAGWVDLTAGAAGVTNLDDSYNGGAAIDVDGDAVTLTTSDEDDNVVLAIVQNEATNDNGAVTITMGTGATGSALTIDSQASGTDITGDNWSVDQAGAATFTSLTTTSFYQTAIASAASGNVALTVDAAGNGTIGIGSNSTGAITLGQATTASSTLAVTGATTMNGAVTLGNAAGDDITITGDVVADIRLDDDTTHSPALQFIDAGENDWAIVKSNGATGNLTVTSDAGTSDFQIVTGNLKVGGGSEGVTLNGEDAYITGTLEVDSTTQLDGNLTMNGEVTAADQIAVNLNANDEEITITGTATNVTASNLITAVMAAQDNNKYILALQQTPNGDADNDFIVCEDNAGATDLFKLEAGGETTWTLDPAADVIIAAADHTAATGALDIDFDGHTDGSEAVNIKTTMDAGGGAAETMSGIYIDLDDDADAAEVLYGIRIDPSDSDGSATIVGLDLANDLDDGIVSTVGAACQALVIDASTAHTETDGVVDIGFASATNGAEAINIDLEADDLGSGHSVAALYIDTDDDTSTNGAYVRGIHLNTSDVDGHADTINQAVYVAGYDCALQADNGYVRIGTGATPGETPGDDDLFVEGTAEIDGVLYADGGIALTNSETIKNDTADEIELAANGKEDVSFNLGTTNTVTLTTDSGTNTWAWGDVDDLTGIGSLAFDAAASTVSLAASGNDQDLTVQVTGAHDASLILQNTGGTGSDSIGVYADGTGGGIDVDTDDGAISITADGVSNGDITIDAQDKVTIVSTDADGTDSIYLHANGGSSEVVKIHSDQGTGADSIHLLSDVGGITLNTGTAGVTFSGDLIKEYKVNVEVFDANDTLGATESGKVCICTGVAGEGATCKHTLTLPSCAAGLMFTIVDANATGDADVWITASAGDTINGGTAAKSYKCTTDAVKQSVTLVGQDDTAWLVISEVGTWANDDS
jgi:hypothetical protein